MSVSVLLAVCLGLIVCLTPLAVYLLWLSVVNRRLRPTVVDGVWDFAGLLLGLSGFLLYGGGLLLALLQSNVRFWARGNIEAFRAAWQQERWAWAAVAVAYLLAVGGAAAVAFYRRRATLVVYNVTPAEFDELLADLLSHTGRTPRRKGRLWMAPDPLLELEAFEAGQAVTVRWLSPDRLLFQEIDRRLREAAPSVPGAGGGTSQLLSSVVIACLILIVVSFFMLLVVVSTAR